MTSLAFAIGSLVMASRADRLREGQWLAISYLGMAIATIFYSLSSAVWVAIALVMISGFMNAPSFIAGRLIVQRNTPREVRGRVSSTMFVTRDIVYMLGMGAAALADVFDVRVVFFVSALVLLGAGLLVLVMPGLGQPAAEWRRAISLLRGAEVAPGLGVGLTNLEQRVLRFAGAGSRVEAGRRAPGGFLVTLRWRKERAGAES